MALTKVITGVTDLNQAQSTNGLKFPTGGAFAGTPEEGMIRNDQSQSSAASSSTMQFYNGTAWKNFVNKTPIPLGSNNFNTVLYQGNGSTQAVTGTAFTPDLVWVKGRSVATSNNLFDSIRGNQRIISNSTGAQVDLNPYAPDGLPSFNSNGFNIGDNFNGDYGLNGDPSGTYGSAAGYVAWCWKAGGTAVSNTDGTITSQVSANVDAGFSIAQFVGDGGSSKTIGHGLTIQPNLVIFKRLNGAVNWFVFFKPAGGNTTGFEGLNTTNAAFSTNYTTFQPSTTTMTTNGVTADFNGSGNSYIMYSFHSVAGYSKIGSYTGNGVSGNAIATGFEPAFVMIKASSASGSWYMFDNKRLTSPYSDQLIANSSAAEATGTYVDLNSNGFTLNTTASDLNNSGVTFIFIAFAAT